MFLDFQNITKFKVEPNARARDRIFLNFLKKYSLICATNFDVIKGNPPTTSCVKCNRMVNIGRI